MTPEQLVAEINTGPLATVIAPLMAAGNDGAIAALLNAPSVPVIGAISRANFAIWAAQTGMRAAIYDHARNLTSPLRSIALSLEDFLAGAAETLDFGKTANRMMLTTWVGAGACTQAQADELLQQATVQISRAQLLWGEPVTIAAIAQAVRN